MRSLTTTLAALTLVFGWTAAEQFPLKVSFHTQAIQVSEDIGQLPESGLGFRRADDIRLFCRIDRIYPLFLLPTYHPPSITTTIQMYTPLGSYWERDPIRTYRYCMERVVIIEATFESLRITPLRLARSKRSG